MHAYTKGLQPALARKAYEIRKDRHYSQENMAHALRIAPRSYSDLEHGIFCFSAPSLILLELMMSELELLRFIHELEEVVGKLEQA